MPNIPIEYIETGGRQGTPPPVVNIPVLQLGIQKVVIVRTKKTAFSALNRE